jgi:hypothetical protein
MTATNPLLLVERPARLADVATFPVDRHRRVTMPAPPRLRLLEGGRSPVVRQRRRVFWPRRVVALIALLLAVAGAVQVVRFVGAVLAPPADGPVAIATHDPSAGPGGVGPVVPAPGSGGAVYVVRGGDTLWSIARAVRPGADPRPIVDALSARVPGGVLQPGERLDLTDLDG